MEHVWSVVCHLSVTDKDNNNISLIESREQISFALREGVSESDIKSIPIPTEIVSMWWRSDLEEGERGRMRLELKSPKGDTLVEQEAEIDLTEYKRLRWRSLFNGLPFTGIGVYRFLVQVKVADGWEIVAAVPLEIIRASPES